MCSILVNISLEAIGFYQTKYYRRKIFILANHFRRTKRKMGNFFIPRPIRPVFLNVLEGLQNLYLSWCR